MDLLSNAQLVAQEYKISKATTRRNERFAKAVEVVIPLRGRDAGLTGGQVMKMSRLKPGDQKKFIHILKEKGKQPRRKVATVKLEKLTLATEPKNLVQKLVDQLVRVAAAAVARMLVEFLRRKPVEQAK